MVKRRNLKLASGEFYQQGDVIIEKVDRIPSRADKQQVNKIVLAEGEQTGHAHVITDIQNCELFVSPLGELYIHASDDVEVKHEEHEAIAIEPGDYVIRGVREYDHFQKQERRVVD